VPFLVLEYLAGGSLRSMLDRGDTLTPSQTLLVGLEATRALEYAHRRGFVHRDIKPANLLFGEEGRLRIADFGLARALAEAAWTEPQGAVLGTARYASPEQAQGMAVTGKADVYSLALVLVEAVTGQVPFTADTTIGTLMARVDRDLEVGDELGPLRSALARAGRSDPVGRLDAHGMAVALMAAAAEMPRPTPLPLAGAVASDDAGYPHADRTDGRGRSGAPRGVGADGRGGRGRGSHRASRPGSHRAIRRSRGLAVPQRHRSDAGDGRARRGGRRPHDGRAHRGPHGRPRVDRRRPPAAAPTRTHAARTVR
jgi:hypothetical protein